MPWESLKTFPTPIPPTTLSVSCTYRSPAPFPPFPASPILAPAAFPAPERPRAPQAAASRPPGSGERHAAPRPRPLATG